MRDKPHVDRLLLIFSGLLILSGVLIFSSASLGLLASGGASFSQVAAGHLGLGLIGGLIVGFFLYKINYRNWKKYAFYIFVFAIVLNILLLIPGIGFTHGGATRWIVLGPVSFQPSELLKIGLIIYLAAWLTSNKDQVGSFKDGFLPFCLILAVPAVLLLMQPDTDTFVIMAITGVAMFLTAGGKFKHAFILFLIGVIGLFVLASFRPYIKERLLTFADPSRDPLNSGYQIQQSLIAIGSGQISGRGFGKSIQKFNYLPEPIGDSIFAVMAEEFGFIGSVGLILLFLLFGFRGLKVASRSADIFGGLLALGIVILILSQSFVNIAAMLGILPLGGIPLLFVSHGGTALLVTIAEVAVLLNISKYAKTQSK